MTSGFARASELYGEGKLAQAEAACTEVLRVDPTHIPALELITDIAFDRGFYESAIQALRIGAAAKPGEPVLAYKLGCLLQSQGQFAEASAAYQSALRLDPGLAKAVNNLGSCLQELGQQQPALRRFEEAVRLDPGLWQAHYNIGNYHKLQGNLEEAIRPFQTATRIARSPGPARPGTEMMFGGTSRSKLRHDEQQLEYLVDRGILGEDYRAVAADLGSVAAELDHSGQTEGLAFPAAAHPMSATFYNRLVNFHDAPALPGGAVNPQLARAAIESDYRRNAPGITFADNFLTPAALAELRRFCLESTIWFDFQYSGGYVGATVEQGFICPLLVQIANELPRTLPGIFGDHKLTHLWGYKYDSTRSGINEHADFAAINVNFWITPDEANLSPESGGLVVWDKEAPMDWDFESYNNDPARIRRYLAESGAKSVTVPYRQNRVVIFNSDLFHKTDAYSFRPDYASRRVNITLLYGYRQKRESPWAR